MSEKPNRRPCWRLLCRLLMRSKRVGRTIGARIGRRLPPTTADCCCGYGKLAASRPTRAPILTQSADYASADCVGLQTVGVVGTALKPPQGPNASLFALQWNIGLSLTEGWLILRILKIIALLDSAGVNPPNPNQNFTKPLPIDTYFLTIDTHLQKIFTCNRRVLRLPY